MDMFSREETLCAGAVLLIFCSFVLLVYLTIEVTKHVRAHRNVPEHHFTLDKTDFTELGEAALRYQRMLSFITESDIGTVQIDIDEVEILETD